MLAKTKEYLLQTKSKKIQQYEDWPSSMPANNGLTCEDMEIICKSM